jgi:hypothetical protein
MFFEYHTQQFDSIFHATNEQVKDLWGIYRWWLIQDMTNFTGEILISSISHHETLHSLMYFPH